MQEEVPFLEDVADQPQIGWESNNEFKESGEIVDEDASWRNAHFSKTFVKTVKMMTLSPKVLQS